MSRRRVDLLRRSVEDEAWLVQEVQLRPHARNRGRPCRREEDQALSNGREVRPASVRVLDALGSRRTPQDAARDDRGVLEDRAAVSHTTDGSRSELGRVSDCVKGVRSLADGREIRERILKRLAGMGSPPLSVLVIHEQRRTPRARSSRASLRRVRSIRQASEQSRWQRSRCR